MTDSTTTSVLIVDDEESVVQLFRQWLKDDYDVHTALNGDEALEILEGDPIDVVLLDRRMPGLSGDEVLETINEEGMDCKVAMVTAVDPGLEVIEMGFDDYVVKPPSREELHQTIENLLERGEHSERQQEYWSLLSKREVLRDKMSESELEESDEYAELKTQIAELRDEIEATQERMGEDVEFLTTLRHIENGSEST
ncbi:response regulator [Halopenitus sp. H-Gu1]|uniref:response regulator n=1 Tax=Halopenitus sp. H-Gu1 TaxID=3242697 RepID=UPI00359DD179